MNTPWNSLPSVELLIILEQIRNRSQSLKVRSAIRQAEDAIRAAEGMKKAIRDLLKEHNSVATIAREAKPSAYYKTVTEVPHVAIWAVRDYLKAVPERNHEQTEVEAAD